VTQPTALILDYGEVLSYPQPPSAMGALASILQSDRDAMASAYWRHRQDYDLGLPAPEYWQRVAADLGRQTLSEDLLQALIRSDIESWTGYRDEMWELVRGFRARGGKVGMLSNGVPEIVAQIRLDHDLEADFDAVVISFEVALAKPDPRIYLLTLERLGVPAAEALFVDDRVLNVDAAEQVGLQGLVFQGDAGLQELRQRLGVDGVRPR
jgi:putative hydrolase of the HAD superfamily